LAHPITFSTDYDFRSDSLYFLGWSQPEALFRWSEGHHVELLFYLPSDSLLPKSIILTVSPLSRQPFRLLLNAHLVGDFVLDNTEQTLSIKVDPGLFIQGAVNVLHFELPDARVPGNGDPRMLALAFKKIKMI
jgi:hypothetical protein